MADEVGNAVYVRKGAKAALDALARKERRNLCDELELIIEEAYAKRGLSQDALIAKYLRSRGDGNPRNELAVESEQRSGGTKASDESGCQAGASVPAEE